MQADGSYESWCKFRVDYVASVVSVCLFAVVVVVCCLLFCLLLLLLSLSFCFLCCEGRFTHAHPLPLESNRVGRRGQSLEDPIAKREFVDRSQP